MEALPADLQTSLPNIEQIERELADRDTGPPKLASLFEKAEIS